jgi:hypothetical protein
MPSLSAGRSSPPRFAWIVATLAAVFCGCGTRYSLVLGATDIRQALQHRLPASKSRLALTVVVSALDIELAEGADRIFFRPQIDASVAGQVLVHGDAVVDGRLRYAPETGELFLTGARVKDVRVAGLPPSLRPVLADALAGWAEGYLARTPILRLRQSDFKHALTRLVLKSVRVRGGGVEVTLGAP